MATVLPSSACAAGELPASTTTPAPSLPTGSDWPRRPAIAFNARSGTRAVATVRSPLPLDLRVSMSAAPNSRPMSDGLIGAASTRTTTSSGAGAGVSTLTSDSSSSPSGLISERSCKPLRVVLLLMAVSFAGPIQPRSVTAGADRTRLAIWVG